METRVVLVARAAMVRECVHALLSVDPLLVVVGELRDLASLDVWLDGHRADVAVFDPAGSGVSPMTPLERLQRSGVRLVVAGTTMGGEWLQAGAVSALPKNASPDDLRSAIHLAAGRGAAPGDMRGELAAAVEGTWASLSRRQREVLLLAADGRTSRQIAKQLGIGTRTVETHRSIGMRRLGVRSYYDLLLRMATALASPDAA